MAGVDRAPKRDGDLLALRELCHQLAADTLESSLVYSAFGFLCIKTFRLYAEFFLGIFLVSKNQVAAGNQFWHYFGN